MKITAQFSIPYLTPVGRSGNFKLGQMSWTANFDQPPFCTESSLRTEIYPISLLLSYAKNHVSWGGGFRY